MANYRRLPYTKEFEESYAGFFPGLFSPESPIRLKAIN